MYFNVAQSWFKLVNYFVFVPKKLDFHPQKPIFFSFPVALGDRSQALEKWSDKDIVAL